MLVVMGNVWRRIIVEFEEYFPWRIAPACDPSEPMERREELADEFYGAESCCVDAGMGRRFRDRVPRSDFFLPMV